MRVLVTRHSGWYGKFAPLDLLCNGRRVASLREKKSHSFQLELADIPATLEVRMQDMVGGPKLVVSSLSTDLNLECGAESWTLFDFFNFEFLPSLNNKVFYFREVGQK
ncbi:MAG: hypothetical protein CVU30_14120 [Betaproteobacteria bacterium HGW-Betaproteobacteria-3]|jgi:hypothetical protein|nr:MAG: hypothetical protein CVU30_14120 [Betaproteobacteria bacterium HGW-Betaproteobacteria-3]